MAQLAAQRAAGGLSTNQATVQSMAGTRQAERSAQELDDLARGLAEIVQQYHA